MYNIVPGTLGATKVIKVVVSPGPVEATNTPTSNNLKTVIKLYKVMNDLVTEG